MFRFPRKSAIAVSTIGALAAAALVPTDASAFYPGHGGYSHGSGGPVHAYMIRRPGPPILLPHLHPHWHFAWHRHYWVPVVATGAVVTAGRCTCLTKDYLPDGSVVFRDLCTKEEAMAPSAERQAADEQANPQTQTH